MTDVTADAQVAQPGGGIPLKTKLARAERRGRRRAYLLVLPLFAFVLIFFFMPISLMMFNSIDNPVIAENLPRTAKLLQAWDPTKSELPPDAVFKTFAEEMATVYKDRRHGRIARRLNFEQSGMLTLVRRSARKIARIQVGPYQEGTLKESLVKIDKRWGERDVWTALRNTSRPLTMSYYLQALDLRYDWKGAIAQVDEDRAIYIDVAIRTFWISGLVTLLCVLLGYPVSFLLANLPLKYSNLLMILVLLPFWTSLLVRTTAWVVVLQTEGVLNDVMLFLGIIGDSWYSLWPDRVQLIFNRFGVVVAMTHILLPFMILPIFSVMKNINPSYVRAARSLGATHWTAFWKVYFPQSVPGIGAGGLLVFILALGYYITPALVGGPTDQMTSYFIADHTERSLNWGLASALGGFLLASVLAIYLIYNRIVGIDNMKLG